MPTTKVWTEIQELPRVLARSAVAIAHTGTTAETALVTIPLAAGVMGLNGVIRITSFWAMPTSANIKTSRVRLGGLGGTALILTSCTTTVANVVNGTISNRNSAASQIGNWISNRATDQLAQISTALTGTVNTALAQDLVISGQVASAAETLTLESYLVELIP